MSTDLMNIINDKTFLLKADHDDIALYPLIGDMALSQTINSVNFVKDFVQKSLVNFRINEGDIFSYNSPNHITKLYDSSSLHNSLFVTNTCDQ